MITYNEFLAALQIVNAYRNKIKQHFDLVEAETKDLIEFIGVTPDSTLSDPTISNRLFNCIWKYGDMYDFEWDGETKLSELSKISVKKFLALPGVGKKTTVDLERLCIYAGVTLQP